MLRETDFIEITDVQYQTGYKLKLTFNDGKENYINFEPFLRKAEHPDIIKYLDIIQFRKFTHKYGHLHWNDYDLSFSIDDLYEKRIS
ncbi:DUF2442 domain-containing protein [Candidatus Magnetomoraceae bacterium gMMP-13]